MGALEVGVFEPLGVVALRVVGAVLRAPALLALQRRDAGALGVVEHVPELDCANQILVEDGAVVVDGGGLRLLLESADRLQRLLDPGLVAEDGNFAVHRLAQLELYLGDAAAGALGAGHQVGGQRLLVLEHLLRGARVVVALGAGGGVAAGAFAEDQRVEQRVGAEAVAAVDRDAGGLAGGVEAGDVGAAVDVGLDPTHRVVVARLDVDRFAGDVDAGEVAADEDDLPQRLAHALARDDGDVERDRPVGEAAALVDLGLLGAGDDVARGQLHLVRRVLLHEPFAVGVEQVGALAAGALGDQEPLARQRRRVVLDHLHVHQLGAGPVGHRDAVAGADQRVSGRPPDLAVATGGEDHRLRLEELHLPVGDVAGDDAAALAVLVEGERAAEPLLVAGDLLGVLHQLLVEDVHDRLAGDVGDVVGAGGGGAAEGAGAELSLLVAVEGDAEVLEVEDFLRRLPGHDFDRVLVAQVVGALDRVERVGLPGVARVQRRVDAALGGVGVGADRVDLADDPDRYTFLSGGESRPLAGETGPDCENVMGRQGRGCYTAKLRAGGRHSSHPGIRHIGRAVGEGWASLGGHRSPMARG